MNKEKCIEVLNDLIAYINENWDCEYEDEVELNTKALKFAIQSLKDGKQVGTLTIKEKEYGIVE